VHVLCTSAGISLFTMALSTSIGSSGSFRKFGNDGQTRLKLTLETSATASWSLVVVVVVVGGLGVVGTARRSIRIEHDTPQLQQQHLGGSTGASPHYFLQKKKGTISHDEKPASDNLFVVASDESVRKICVLLGMVLLLSIWLFVMGSPDFILRSSHQCVLGRCGAQRVVDYCLFTAASPMPRLIDCF
jgi:hypothetical protein